MIQQTMGKGVMGNGAQRADKGWWIRTSDPNCRIVIQTWTPGTKRDAQAEAVIARRELIARMIDES